jgi:hypothetical protein
MTKPKFSKGTRVRPNAKGRVLLDHKLAGVCVNQRPDKFKCVLVRWDAPAGGMTVTHIDFLETIPCD